MLLTLMVTATNIEASKCSKLVIGMAHAVDEEHKNISTFFIEENIRDIGSITGWRQSMLLILFMTVRCRTKKASSLIGSSKKEVVLWRNKNQAPSANWMPVVIWKVRGFRELAGDAAVDFNKFGLTMLKQFLSQHFIILEGKPLGAKQAYVLRRNQIKARQVPFKSAGTVIFRVDKSGLVLNTYDFDLSPQAEKAVDFKLMMFRPSWYPRYQMRLGCD